jgi:flagellar protein FlaG
MADIISSALPSLAVRIGQSSSAAATQGRAQENVSPLGHAQDTALGVPASPKIEAIDQAELQEKLKSIVENLNEQAQRNGRDIGFSVDERLNRSIVTVTSSTTGEVIRQIPSEVVIRVGNRIEDLKGILFDEEL